MHMATSVQSPSSEQSMEVGSAQMSLSPATPDEDDATKQTMQLVWQLQQQEFAFAEHAAALEQEGGGGARHDDDEVDDEESLALAIRLQQEDDEAQLRSVLGAREGETGSPSAMSFEQLLRLGEAVGEVREKAGNARGLCM